MSLRPGGVTGIAILFLLGAVGFIAFGLMCLLMGDFVMDFYNNNIGPLLAGLPIVVDRLADVSANTVLWAGILCVPVGIADIITFFGLLKLKKWGYWLAIIISIPLIVAIIGIVFIWYLRKDEVKAAFDIM